MSTLLLLASIRLDSGNQFVAIQPVLHPDTDFEARVLQWGSINRSIPVPAGLPQVSDANIRIADTDFKFRNLFVDGTQTPLDRFVEIRMVEEGASFATGTIIYTGVITRFAFGDGYVELVLHDVTLDWLDEEWPGTIANGIYAPTLFGRLIQNSPNDQHGLIPLPHIGFDLALGDRYIASWHTNNDIVGIHRLNTDGTWELVDPSEYSVTEDDVDIGGIIHTGTYIDFTVQQDDGVETRADVEGWDTRPAWGSLGAASGLLRNPIDFFINIMVTIQEKIGKTLDFDYTAIEAIRTLFLTVVDTSPGRAYFCDGALLQPITMRSLLSQFLTSFNLDLFQTVDGKISLPFMHTADGGRDVFLEALHVIEGSYRQNSPDDYANRIKCKMARNYATNEWSIEQIHDNTVDQNLLGTGSPVVPKIKGVDLEMWFARDRFTAADVAAHRAGFLALNSYDQEFDSPFELITTRELAEQIGLTITSGLATGGFTNQECRVNGLILNLDDFSFTVSARIYREQAMNTPSSLTYELDASITMTSTMDAELLEAT